VLTEGKSESHRLPRIVVPIRYDIRIEPDLLSGAFAGEETIEVSVREPVKEVVLNAAELWIQEVTIQNQEGGTFNGIVALDHGGERARLLFLETLRPGPWRLSLKFNGSLSDKLRGFYWSIVKRSSVLELFPLGGGSEDIGTSVLVVI
jgi:puromycin-sensitive aminopeptidase